MTDFEEAPIAWMANPQMLAVGVDVIHRQIIGIMTSI